MRSRAFTFAELLAAMVFVAIVLPVAVGGIGLAARMSESGERRRTAVALADSLLTELAVTGDWRTSAGEGDFEDDWPGYRWELEDEAWEEDAMRVVTIEVFYPVAGREQSVRLTTLMPEEDEE